MKLSIVIALSLLTLPVYADDNKSTDEQEKWLDQDDSFDPDLINEGELKFLSELPEKPVLHSINALTISQNSIDNGWVLLEQCYKHLDPVPNTEVVYNYKSMRGLSITSKSNIESAVVNGQSVRLTNITKNASLCVKAEIRIFYSNPDGTFSLLNGPFYRKFLDGYYPYRVTLTVNYPSSLLKLIKTKPVAQAGFNVKKTENTILIDTHFEGMLNTEIIFQALQLTTHYYTSANR